MMTNFYVLPQPIHLASVAEGAEAGRLRLPKEVACVAMTYQHARKSTAATSSHTHNATRHETPEDAVTDSNE